MGLGDWIMATAEARGLQKTDPRPVVAVNKRGHPTWSEVFENNPRFAPKGTPISDDVQVLSSRSGNRPYIDYKKSTSSRWAWKNCPPEPGEIYFSPEEQEKIDTKITSFIYVEPTIKDKAPPNKQWPFERWQQLVAIKGRDWIQSGPQRSAEHMLGGVYQCVSHTFREALVTLARCHMYVGHEGAMHHAAAALGIPAVVIYGGFVSPAQTGYESQINLCSGGEPCGRRVECAHCATSMRAITVRDVLDAIETLEGQIHGTSESK